MSDLIRTERAARCLLCGEIGFEFYKGLPDRLHKVPGRWSFSRCPACHLVWLNPRPIPEDVAACYPSGYFTHVFGDRPTFGATRLKQQLRFVGLSSGLGYNHLGSRAP